MANPQILPVAVVGVGAYLFWFGVHYWDSDTKYPADPVKAVLTGKPLPAVKGQTPAAAVAASVGTAEQNTAVNQTVTGSGTSPQPGVSAPTGTAAANQAIGQRLAAKYGWNTGTEWDDLVKLWNQESGWSNTAQNPTSTAFGIAQFLDTTWAPYGPKTADAATQITYGLEYIHDRYGSPSGAWAHEQGYNWY